MATGVLSHLGVFEYGNYITADWVTIDLCTRVVKMNNCIYKHMNIALSN